jgi:hypothetical protein
MGNVSEPLASTVQAAFSELANTASEVNLVSDELGKFIVEIEDGLKSLNLGVASWVEISKSVSADGDKRWVESLGFDKVHKNWCLALRNVCETDYLDEYLEHDLWPFNEAPRWLRIKGIDRLPALLVKLNADAQSVKKHLGTKLGTVAEVANGIKTAASVKKAQDRRGAK